MRHPHQSQDHLLVALTRQDDPDNLLVAAGDFGKQVGAVRPFHAHVGDDNVNGLLGQDAEGVVHRLPGDDADPGPDGVGHVVGRAVRPLRHRPQQARLAHAAGADQLNPAQTHWTSHSISRGVTLKVPYPYGFTPHRAQYAWVIQGISPRTCGIRSG